MLAIALISMASCNDWLTVLPQDKITEENFWKDKTDLEGVRYAAYMTLGNQLEKMRFWGDLRSDIYKLPDSKTNRDMYFEILNGNIDTTYTQYDWADMYKITGYCNKVLHYGEGIMKKDPNFTETEWKYMRAEMKTMRALAYFYLVRAFKYIPYTTKMVNLQSEMEYFPQIPALDVLTSLITDVEDVVDEARSRFLNDKETKGLITNTAICALLSEMYLWRASMLQGRGETARAIEDYNKCIMYSEMSVERLINQFEQATKNSPYNSDLYHEWKSAPLFNGKELKLMYRNDVRDAHTGRISLDAYAAIFADGKNSYESIFELQEHGVTANDYMWGDEAVLYYRINDEAKYSKYKNKDIRYWINACSSLSDNADLQEKAVLKWEAAKEVEVEDLGGTDPSPKMKLRERKENAPKNNWIIWRLSDMLLNDAEARACLADLDVNKIENADICHKLLRMVNRRWWVDLKKGQDVEAELDPEKIDNYVNSDIADYDNMGYDPETESLKLVMETRKLEFVAEGKRWFDLVRYAERKSTSDDDSQGMYQMYEDFMKDPIEGDFTLRNRWENLWGLYSPIFFNECKAYRAKGINLIQNPVWNKTKYERK